MPSLVALLGEREQRRAHVRAALADHERQRVAPRDAGAVLDVMRAALVEWQATLRAETGAARTALQALIRGRFVFTPVESDGVRGYSFKAEGTIEPVIAGMVQTMSKGSGTRTRTIPPDLRRALQHRDQGCRFPGCGVRIAEGIISNTGRRAAPPRSRISRYSAVGIIAPYTKRVSTSRPGPMGCSRSGGRMATRCPKYRHPLRDSVIPSG